MATLTDVVDYDGGGFFLTDADLDDQISTLSYEPGQRLYIGTGAVRINTTRDQARGLARVSVEVGDNAFPVPPANARLVDERTYHTQRGAQRIRDSNLEECQGQLATPITAAGPATVHIRVYEIPAPHDQYLATAPNYADRLIDIDEHLLLHIWNEPTADSQAPGTRTQLRGVVASDGSEPAAAANVVYVESESDAPVPPQSGSR
ncbi:hypothetical protein [Nocardia sp. XZ_19_369]|uniref:hypothetical protein n=1 Tax=Nocardia sp. XZ_19_369 TaxID=2769487 RepID=UPI00188E65F0|nr:hypothetical protein [Nocardia sp. XZ_19_369]